jgi:hypothetical protein
MTELLKQLREWQSMNDWRAVMLKDLRVKLAEYVPKNHTIWEVELQEHSLTATLYHSQFDCWSRESWSITLVTLEKDHEY